MKPANKHVIVVNPHVETDPDRSTFYQVDKSITYLRLGFAVRPGLFGKLRTYAVTFIKLMALIREKKPELLVYASPRIGLPLEGLFRLLRIKHHSAIWSFNILRPYSGLQSLAARFSLQAIDHIVVYSRHEKERYSNYFRIPDQNVIFKHLAGPYLEDPRYAALRDLPKQGYVVSPGYSGRDFELLARVARMTPQLSIVILAYPKSIGDVSFPSNVQVVHGISELEYCKYIATANVCFVPVKNRTTANGHIAIVQAMSLKTLLLTNTTPGTEDYLSSDVNSVIFDANNDENTATQLLELTTNIDHYTDIIDRAFDESLKRSSIQTDINLIHQMIGKRNS